jgi:2-polyprenyl-3-methyl-5-hydroxy-6-metoxy-1,4-benzoquinol methylase
MPKNWVEFWQKENHFDNLMISNHSFFLSKIEKFIQISPNHRVLDIGSGPGYLSDAWHNRVSSIDGLDISKRYNEIARSKHADKPHIQFHDLDESDFLNFDRLKNRQFDLVVIMSVLQYYKNFEDVKKLFIALKKILSPSATVLVCDVITTQGGLKEVFSVLFSALQSGKIWGTLKLFIGLLFSDYYKVRKQSGLLVVNEKLFVGYCNEIGWKVEVINEPVTLQKERKSFLIRSSD